MAAMDESSEPGATPHPTRRAFHAASAAGGLWLSLQLLGHAPPARAQSGGSLLSGLAGISNSDASAGVKAALEKGALAAVSLLGRPDGFLANPRVRIPLPGALEDVGKVMRTFGQGKRVDELENAMNRAAEAAVPMGRDVLVNAARNITVTDAKNILTGGETSVTDYFSGRTREPLSALFLPLVTRATEQVQLAGIYNDFAGRAKRFGLVQEKDANLQQYVTGKTLDGLFVVIGEEERKIRQDPVGAGSDILRKVFGALK